MVCQTKPVLGRGWCLPVVRTGGRGRAQGSSAAQVAVVPRARRGSFRRQCSLSIILLACGWLAVVGWCLICNKRHNEFQILEVNCAPLSDVMMAGTPNLQIHPENNAAATSAAAVLARGMASIQQLVLSITVKMWLKPLEGVRGPTRLMCMWAKGRYGTGIDFGRT